MQVRPTTRDEAEALTDLHLDVWEEAYDGLIAADILAQRHATPAPTDGVSTGSGSRPKTNPRQYEPARTRPGASGMLNSDAWRQ